MAVGSRCRASDGASCGTSSPGIGRTVQQSVGTLGSAWNQPSDSRHFNVLGYPQAAPFNGALLRPEPAPAVAIRGSCCGNGSVPDQAERAGYAGQAVLAGAPGRAVAKCT